MLKFLERYQDQAYAALRMVAGFLFLWHGSQKVLGMPGGIPEAPAFILYVAGPIELIGGLLILVGLFTRYAAFLCSGLMAFAYWLGHGTKAVLPVENGGELAALYCFLFLFIATRGSGIWSVEGNRGA